LHLCIENECVQVSEGGCAPGVECVDTLQTFSYTHGDTTTVRYSPNTHLYGYPNISTVYLCPLNPAPSPSSASTAQCSPAHPHHPPSPHPAPHPSSAPLAKPSIWPAKSLHTRHGQHADSLRTERYVQPVAYCEEAETWILEQD
jgi:hypothetical protein